MSNLLKSKTLKVGGLVIIMALAIVVMLSAAALTANAQTTTTVVASGYTYSGVMKIGMSGPGISTLQAALNEVNVTPTIVVDGKFGPATLAAVKKFQMTHGLVADGVVGPLTGAKLAASTVSVITVPTGNLPAGCTSTSGFSTTTGVRCDSMPSLPAGCSSTLGYSPTTGVKCSTGVSNLPAGCTSTSGFSSTTGVRCDGGSSSNPPSDNELSGGETDISDVNVNDAEDDTLSEGATEAPVAEIEFDVNDADAELVRVDVVFQYDDGQTGGEEDPWDVFDRVYLLDEGGDVIAEVDGDDEDAWEDADDLGSNTEFDAQRIRFNNVDEVYNEGDNASLWVAVDVASNVDGSDTDDANWTVGLDTDGLRFTDSAGLDTEEDAGTETAQFSIEEAGAESDFNVNESDESPDAQTVEVDESSSAEITLAIFDVDTDEDGGDIKINDFPVGIKMTVLDGTSSVTSNFDDVIDEVFVTLDGTKYTGDYESLSCGAGDTTLALCDAGDTATFGFEDIDDDDVIIGAGDNMEVEVSVKFHSQGAPASTAYANGTTAQAFAQVAANDVEDAESGDDIGDVDGTANGDVMTLSAAGIMVEVNSATTTVTEIDGALNDTVTFTWSIDITAFGDDDVFVNADFADVVQAADDAAADVDMVYDIESSDGVTTALDASDSGTVTDTSDADEVTADASAYGGTYAGETFFRISEGETETFTITVSATNGNANKQVRAFLTELEFTTDEVDAATAQDASVQSVQAYTANLQDDSETPFEAVQ